VSFQETEELTELARTIVSSTGRRLRRDVSGVEYTVEEVTWPVSAHPDGSSPFACPHTALTLVRGDAVLFDVRHDYDDGSSSYGTVGDRLGRWMRFRIGSPGDRGWDLHLATDDEVEAFRREAAEVAAAFEVPGP
jgi:hypothetical protein